MTADARIAGVIGLGAVGAPVASRLAASGYDVVAYDLDPGALRALDAGARAVASTAAVGDAADVVFIAVFDDGQLRAVLSGPNGLLSTACPAPVVVVLSTVGMDTIQWANREAARRGVALLDCGITGGQGLREHGMIVVLAGGDEAVLEHARPMLETFAAPLLHMGPSGAGMQAKHARDLIHYGGWHVAWEGARLASACGLDVAKLVAAVRISDGWSGGIMGLVAAGAGFGVDGGAGEPIPAPPRKLAALGHKDLRAALDLAAQHGISLPGTEVAERAFDHVVGLDTDEDG
jgi:3-hydroxyisobutyrate dehydrogenase-like beta-hydroxyacid dehydrogenase